MFRKKNIIMGISASIALYKAPLLISALRKQGFNIEVVMTKNAIKLMSPQIFEVLTGNEVFVAMFGQGLMLKHIELMKRADLMVICPATANIIGKLANGIADDLLTTISLTSKVPRIVCPAMNTAMWENALVQDNLRKLKKFGFKIIEPETGLLACGDSGKGRLADLDLIEEEIKMALVEKDLMGKKVLITAGATIEKIDAVRYISNFSSGKMGWSLAKVARRKGAKVTLISGKVEESVKKGMVEDEYFKIIFVESAEEMYREVMAEVKSSEVFISAAAVADYGNRRTRPSLRYGGQAGEQANPSFASLRRAGRRTKMPKTKLGKVWNLKLEQNPDILKEVGKLKKKPFLVGFALETDNLIQNAKRKLKEKGLDLIIANGIENLGNDQKEAILISKKAQEKLPRMKVDDLADKILGNIL